MYLSVIRVYAVLINSILLWGVLFNGELRFSNESVSERISVVVVSGSLSGSVMM